MNGSEIVLYAIAFLIVCIGTAIVGVVYTYIKNDGWI
jgi:hypothetical protein